MTHQRLDKTRVGEAFYCLDPNDTDEYVRVYTPTIVPGKYAVLNTRTCSVSYLLPSTAVIPKEGPRYFQVTGVRIRLPNPTHHRDKAFKASASVTINNSFVINEIKIIDRDGELFISMPARRFYDHCPFCECKNPVDSLHCSSCGIELKENRAVPDPRTGKIRAYVDIAHPTDRQTRGMIQRIVLDAYHEELRTGRDVRARAATSY